MRDFATKNKIVNDTLCWRSAYGNEWKPFSNTELYQVDDNSLNAPPPLPPSLVSNRYAYAIGFVPLLGAILEQIVAQNRPTPPSLPLVATGYFIVQSILVILDTKAIDRSGHRKARGRPAAWWLLLVPVYLWKRATYLGQRKVPFWAWIACCVLGVVFQQPEVSDGMFMVALPQCSGAYASTEVDKVFSSIVTVKQAGIKALRLDNGQQVASTPNNKSCTGTIVATDDRRYPVAYRFEKKGDTVYIHVRMLE